MTIDWIIPALQMTFWKLPQSMIVKDNVSTPISFYAVALLTGNFVDVAVISRVWGRGKWSKQFHYNLYIQKSKNLF